MCDRNEKRNQSQHCHEIDLDQFIGRHSLSLWHSRFVVVVGWLDGCLVNEAEVRVIREVQSGRNDICVAIDGAQLEPPGQYKGRLGEPELTCLTGVDSDFKPSKGFALPSEGRPQPAAPFFQNFPPPHPV